ncbi:MAG: hypothetical protein WCP89_02250 [archaeon]
MANKDDAFDFPEAELVKQTELFRDCTNIVIGDGSLHGKTYSSGLINYNEQHL